RYLAYVSNESGRPELYLTRFPDLGGKWQISTTVAQFPRWSRDGRDLYFIGQGDHLVRIHVDEKSGVPQFSPPETLFTLTGSFPACPYDLAADGRILATILVSGSSDVPLTLVVGGATKLQR
ncbi:MAG TPA: hypothetical protein VIM68_03330, partial [Thermoanaerobaculia bacterium]